MHRIFCGAFLFRLTLSWCQLISESGSVLLLIFMPANSVLLPGHFRVILYPETWSFMPAYFVLVPIYFRVRFCFVTNFYAGQLCFSAGSFPSPFLFWCVLVSDTDCVYVRRGEHCFPDFNNSKLGYELAVKTINYNQVQAEPVRNY